MEHKLTKKITSLKFPVTYSDADEVDKIIREYLKEKADKIWDEFFHRNREIGLDDIKKTLNLNEETLEEKYRNAGFGEKFLKQLVQIASDHYEKDRD